MKAPRIAFGLLLVAPLAAGAQGWDFDAAISVTGEPVEGVFHHLDGAGRKHIAADADSVAVVWEDDRDGSPQIYLALKPRDAKRFSAALGISDGDEAFEPAIASLSAGRYGVAWEQDGEVHARLVVAGQPSAKLRLAPRGASHASLAAHGERLYASWREQHADGWRIRVASLRADDANRLEIDALSAVEAAAVPAPIQFPSLAVNRAGICIAWEDRRAGHTRLLSSFAARLAAGFSPPRDLNEYFSGRNQYDMGSGVTRVALAGFGGDEVLAAWMDKRRSGGYGIFAALGSGDLFGPNEKVHGAEGDLLAHNNPAVAGNPAGDFAVAWDDYRRGDSDVWISNYAGDFEWSEDFAPPPASGPGEQSNVSIAMDADGVLHLLWLDRATVDAPGQLRYSRGVPR